MTIDSRSANDSQNGTDFRVETKFRPTTDSRKVTDSRMINNNWMAIHTHKATETLIPSDTFSAIELRPIRLAPSDSFSDLSFCDRFIPSCGHYAKVSTWDIQPVGLSKLRKSYCSHPGIWTAKKTKTWLKGWPSLVDHRRGKRCRTARLKWPFPNLLRTAVGQGEKHYFCSVP